MSNLSHFTKFINGYTCQATPIYDGHWINDVFVMSFKDRYWFDMELRGIGMLSNKSYAPEIQSVNTLTMQIKFKWYNTNLNHMFHYNKELPSDWRQQILDILKDLENINVYKINIYPHTFYLKDDKIHVMDLHACISTQDKISEEVLKNIINNKDRFSFKNGFLDIKYAYDYTLKNNIGDWPGGALHA
tara:strand:+ start:246 stop:809 length:564 start_codon:yes stop_codon:yes gene_type:complete